MFLPRPFGPSNPVFRGRFLDAGPFGLIQEAFHRNGRPGQFPKEFLVLGDEWDPKFKRKGRVLGVVSGEVMPPNQFKDSRGIRVLNPSH